MTYEDGDDEELVEADVLDLLAKSSQEARPRLPSTLQGMPPTMTVCTNVHLHPLKGPYSDPTIFSMALLNAYGALNLYIC